MDLRQAARKSGVPEGVGGPEAVSEGFCKTVPIPFSDRCCAGVVAGFPDRPGDELDADAAGAFAAGAVAGFAARVAAVFGAGAPAGSADESHGWLDEEACAAAAGAGRSALASA